MVMCSAFSISKIASSQAEDYFAGSGFAQVGIFERQGQASSFFTCVVFKISSGIRSRATGWPFTMCDSIISSTSSGRTPP